MHYVDAYLLHVHKNRRRLTDEDWNLTILRAGAYVGEVMRHAAPPGNLGWVDYDEYMPEHPDLQSMIPELLDANGYPDGEEIHFKVVGEVNDIVAYREAA